MSELSKTPSWLDVKSHSRSRRASVSGSVNANKPDQSPHLNTFHDLQTGRHLQDSDYFHLSSRLYAESMNYSDHRASDSANTRVCNLYLQSDTYLWDRVMGLQHIKGNRELAVKEITSIFMQHVQGAQAIYQYTVFKDHSERLNFPGISFRVDHVRINITEEDCKRRRSFDSHPPSLHSPTAMPQGGGENNRTGAHHHPLFLAAGNLTTSRFSSAAGPALGSYADENPFCAANIDVTNYLNLHSYSQHDDFCLAYVFTYRDFSSGTLGLAWVAEPSGSGGVCERHRLMREGAHTVYKNLNTGVLTLLNYGSQVALKVSQLTFAHEIGHNFGAKHDDDHKEEPYGCLPSVEDPRGNYIMFASATSGDKENNNKFSVCSSDAIARLLDRVLSSDSNCFLSSDGPFCGNQLTEDGEQCDCGFTAASCRDQCCHPKDSSAPCRLTDRIRLNGTLWDVQCSPTAGECCTQDCQYRDQSHLCRAAGECHRPAHCNGVDSKCPPSVHLPNGTPCQEHTRVCKEGQCLGSICERIPGWHECSLTRDGDKQHQVTPEMMCYVACRENVSGAPPCISTYELQQDIALQEQYPNLASELLHNGRGTQFKPGTPCDNYRGYCDVFLRCQSVVAVGPLVRLHNLLFSPQVLQRINAWITIHWWAVILICLGVIISMIIFVKLFAVNTPAARHQFSAVGSRQAFAPPPVFSVSPTGAPVLWTGSHFPPLPPPLPARSGPSPRPPPPYSRELPQPQAACLSRKQRNALRAGGRRKQKASGVGNAPPVVPSAPPLPEDTVRLLSGHVSEAHPVVGVNSNSSGDAVAGQMNRQNSGSSSPQRTRVGHVTADASEFAAPRQSANTCSANINRPSRPQEAGRPKLKSRLRRSPPPSAESRTETAAASTPSGARVRAVVPASRPAANTDRSRVGSSGPPERLGPSTQTPPPVGAGGRDCRNIPPPAYDEI